MFFRIESPATNNMENSTHSSVSDNLDGVLMQEKKDKAEKIQAENGVKETHVSNMRVVEEKSYTAKQSKEKIENDTVNDDDLDWEENWNSFRFGGELVSAAPTKSVTPDVASTHEPKSPRQPDLIREDEQKWQIRHWGLEYE